MPKKQRASAAENSARPNQPSSSTPSVTHETDFPCELYAAPQERIPLLRTVLTRCTLCGNAAVFHSTYCPTEQQYARWRRGWIGFALCIDCWANPEWVLPQLIAKFEFYFESGHEGLVQ